jgi:nucleoid-associated protein YgaU
LGLLSFVKDAGEKLLNTEPDNDASADAIKTYVGTRGIDTSGLSVSFDGATVTVSGEAPDQATAEKIILCCGNVKGVAAVNNQVSAAATSAEAQFYTVVSGDSLSKIAQRCYGNPNQYPVIFEANKPMLPSLDKIYPGQMLRIPPLA